MQRLIPSTDGVVLEVLVEEPRTIPADDWLGTVVLCHPHPTQGGTMRHPILGAIAAEALEAGLVTVRFNFRGVGESTGSYDNGIGEVSDVACVVDFVERELPPLTGIAGWSFGAAVSLGWQARSGSTVPYVGIAPPVKSPLTPHLPDASELAEARRLFVVGERDQFVDVDALAVYAGSIGADILIYPGSDHFFVFKHKKLATDVVAAILTSDI
ncbi:MAG: hypothetical protein M5U23_03675 [Acidimicrobiia bacterium]|nr:hypothetical protein [Acidimicrobiia bacterium]